MNETYQDSQSHTNDDVSAFTRERNEKIYFNLTIKFIRESLIDVDLFLANLHRLHQLMLQVSDQFRLIADFSPKTMCY